MFDRMGQLGVLQPEMIAKYKQHVDNLDRYNLEDEEDDIIMPGEEDIEEEDEEDEPV
jgi:hypothetical protein